MDLKLVTTVDAENPVVGDLELRNGQLVWLGEDPDDVDEARAETAQRLRVRLHFAKGEWFLDQRLGLPIWEEMLVKAPDLSRVRRAFREAIAGTPGIESVESVEVSLDSTTRELSVDFTATTADGQTITAADLDAPYIVEVTR